MTTKPHSTDAMEMPERFVEYMRNGVEHNCYTADQLREFAVKAYDLALEDAAKKCNDLWEDDATAYDCKLAIRSKKK